MTFLRHILPSNFYGMTHPRQLLRMTKREKKPKDKVERADGRSQIKRCLTPGSNYLRRGKGHLLPRTGTMQSSRLLSGTLLCALLLLSSTAGAEVLDSESEEELSPRALRDFYPKGPNLTSEKQLVSFCASFCTRKIMQLLLPIKKSLSYFFLLLKSNASFSVFCLLHIRCGHELKSLISLKSNLFQGNVHLE